MKVLLGVSNRHVHLTKEDYRILFADEPLQKVKDLVQPGQFSSDKKVTISIGLNFTFNLCNSFSISSCF